MQKNETFMEFDWLNVFHMPIKLHVTLWICIWRYYEKGLWPIMLNLYLNYGMQTSHAWDLKQYYEYHLEKKWSRIQPCWCHNQWWKSKLFCLDTTNDSFYRIVKSVCLQKPPTDHRYQKWIFLSLWPWVAFTIGTNKRFLEFSNFMYFSSFSNISVSRYRGENQLSN